MARGIRGLETICDRQPPTEIRALENELLEELHRGSLADVDYGEVHKFCTDKEWKNPAVKSLFL